MTDDTTSDDRLAELRQRWEEDPGSRIFLQLAEEYRKVERYDDAVEVLTKGLESHPSQVSALVALGRSRLALGQPGEAAEALEKAVAIDATNLAAMKLSVEAYLQQGDREHARQRLELYKLLNEGDEEIEELEARIDQRATPPPPPAAAASADSAPTAGEAADDEAEDDRPAADDMAAAEGAAPSEAPSSAPESWSPTAAWPGLPKEEPGEPAAEPDESQPFGELASEGERRLYLAALRSEGLFAIDDEAGDAPAPESAPATEATPAGVPEPGREPSRERPTVTLGNLYLEQGHADEAERIFRTLLEADPDNAAARAGLARARAATDTSETIPAAAAEPAAESVAEAPGFTLTAEQLLSEADPSEPPRVGLLHAYLRRIRNSS